METPKDTVASVVDEANKVLSDPNTDKKARKTVKKTKPKKEAKHADELITLSAKEYDRVVIPEDENDPHWDPKLKNPVPEGVIDSLADVGWNKSMAAIAIRIGGNKLKIVHGKTRWRAIPAVNKLRAKLGQPPIEPVILVTDEDPGNDEQILANMMLNVGLNYSVQHLDPMTTAESITRLLSAGIEEKVVARKHNVTVNDLHGYLLLTDDEKCPPRMQELIRSEKVPFTAALGWIRSTDAMSLSQKNETIDPLEKLVSGGVKLTSAQLKKAAGKEDETVATRKQVKQFLLDLQSDKPTGKHGEATAMGAVIGIEVALGTRSIKSAEHAIAKLAKGEHVKVDFKQYQDGTQQPVKGQDK